MFGANGGSYLIMEFGFVAVHEFQFPPLVSLAIPGAQS